MLLRIAILLIIAAAIAQFTLNTINAAILGGSQRGIIVIWDDSYSMGYHAERSPSAFEKSRKLLADWIAHLPSSDRVALLRASAGGEPLIASPTPELKAVGRAIADAQLSDAGTDLAGALDRAAGLAENLEPTTRQRQVIVITDCSRSSIHAQDGSIKSTDEVLKKAGGKGQEVRLFACN